MKIVFNTWTRPSAVKKILDSVTVEYIFKNTVWYVTGDDIPLNELRQVTNTLLVIEE